MNREEQRRYSVPARTQPAAAVQRWEHQLDEPQVIVGRVVDPTGRQVAPWGAADVVYVPVQAAQQQPQPTPIAVPSHFATDLFGVGLGLVAALGVVFGVTMSPLSGGYAVAGAFAALMFAALGLAIILFGRQQR